MTPTINYPISIIEQPSTKKKLKFRPFTVREEKLLLMAKQTNEYTDIISSIKTVIQNCCQEKDFNIDKLALFDLEFLFIKLRAISVNNVERFVAKDQEDNKEYQHVINLNDVKIWFPAIKPDSNVTVGDNITVTLKYPSVDMFNDKDIKTKLDKDGLFELALNCIDKIFEGENLLKISREEKIEFLDNIDSKAFNKIKDFIFNIPRLEEYKVTYINSLGNERAWVFRTLRDFFFFL